ncbi:hypothetical protein FBUS_06451 [Fasciolopsis buskii]|uniref:MICOS complex subunit MIC19 n=1 Tax=Fasciolopsis buskii TaxID=27845 RepID=A0A8E0VLL9_9TREM|nr:hypothetical protein FBUS_06451 [Fasciolopsis buski]
MITLNSQVTSNVLNRIHQGPTEPRPAGKFCIHFRNPANSERPSGVESDLSLQLKYEHELEKEYDRRLRLVEQRNEELFREAAEEYTRTVERLENKYMRPIPGGCCTAAEQRVEDCYQSNPSKTLLCSKLVSEYARCVNNFRLVRSSFLILSIVFDLFFSLLIHASRRSLVLSNCSSPRSSTVR